MAASVHELVADLAAETDSLETLLADLSDADWERATPAAGWAIRDQIAHLAFFDDMAVLAMADPERFAAEAKAQLAAGPDLPDRAVEERRSMPVADLHAWFRRSRRALLDTAARCDPAERVPWYGPAMSLASCITARAMETWAHGEDVADALGVRREPTARLRHVAHIGVRAMPFSYVLRGLPVPETPVRVELLAPDGDTWTWGPEDAVDRVDGPALDFCLLVTQRRHLLDTGLRAVGPVASEWMSIAQAYAGSVGPGRAPGAVAST